mgnify:CR=1 FL=1
MNIDQIKQWLSTPEMQEKLRYGGYGALGGAALGGVNHMMTNEDEEGSGGRLMKNLALGGAMGGVAGLGAHSAKDLMKPVKEKSELEAFLDKRPAPYGSVPANIAGQAAQGARNPFVMGGVGAAGSMWHDHKYLNSKDSKLNDAIKIISGDSGKALNEQWGKPHLGTVRPEAEAALTSAFSTGRTSPQMLDSIRSRIGNVEHMPVGHQTDLHTALGDKANKYVSPLGGMLDKTIGGVQNAGIGIYNQLNKFIGKPAPTTINSASANAGVNSGLMPAGSEWLNKLTGLQGVGGNHAGNAVMPGEAFGKSKWNQWLNSPTVAQSIVRGGNPTGNLGRSAANAGRWGLAGMLASKPIDMGMHAFGDKWLQSDAYKKHMMQAEEMARQATKQQPQQVR